MACGRMNAPAECMMKTISMPLWTSCSTIVPDEADVGGERLGFWSVGACAREWDHFGWVVVP